VDQDNPIGYNPEVKADQEINYEGKAITISKK